jgi:uncharacterized protein YcgL (UPF0745 family)
MLCIVYKSSRRPDTFVYVADPGDLAKLPPALAQALGALAEVLRFELTPQRKLAREDARLVCANIDQIGYHIQFPPADAIHPADPTA